MTPKRSRIEIYFDVLKVIGKGTHKLTRIMYKANLSWRSVTKILESLLDQNLIVKDEVGDRVTYWTTEKGRNVLGYFKQVEDLIEVT